MFYLFFFLGSISLLQAQMRNLVCRNAQTGSSQITSNRRCSESVIINNDHKGQETNNENKEMKLESELDFNTVNKNVIDKLSMLNDTINRHKQLISSIASQLQNFAAPSKQASYSTAFGVKDGRVQNSQMTASSEHSNIHAAHQGRLDYQESSNPRRSGSWSAKGRGIGNWLQVDLIQPTFVTGVVTQGRDKNSKWFQWVTSYKIAFGNRNNSLQFITNNSGKDMVFSGNFDQNTYVMNRFPQPIRARYFRLVVQAFHHYVSLRLDYVTC